MIWRSKLKRNFAIEFECFIRSKRDVDPFGTIYLEKIKLTLTVDGHSRRNCLSPIASKVYSKTANQARTFYIYCEWTPPSHIRRAKKSFRGYFQCRLSEDFQLIMNSFVWLLLETIPKFEDLQLPGFRILWTRRCLVREQQIKLWNNEIFYSNLELLEGASLCLSCCLL